MALSKILNFKSPEKSSDKITRLKDEVNSADSIIIGAGAGLSTSAGFIYTGERFRKYFKDFSDKYEFNDMYSGGFYPYKTPEEFWAYWSRYIYVNRYMDAPKPLYQKLFELVKDKDYFVLTTNVDHCFQKAGFDKHRLFYTQGDYGLFQCSKPCHDETYDNEKMVRDMVEAQGFTIDGEGVLSELPSMPEASIKMTIPTELIPRCPKCGEPLTTNLRSDDRFVEDEGWHIAAERYENFTHTRKNTHILFLELGVGYNTPGIIKYPFWQMTMNNPKAVYACLNFGEAVCPREIEKQSICIDGDIGEVVYKWIQS
jgi:NAD-dependent SIR2 family protein deacetylase